MRYPMARWAFLSLIVLTLGACANTTLVGDWENPNYQGPVFSKFLVMSVNRDNSVRRIFEDQFAGELKAHDVNAVPSYQYIGTEGQASEEEVRKAIESSGADAVLITRLVKVEQGVSVTPGYVATTGIPPLRYRGEFYGYYASAWTAYYTPPTAYEYQIYSLATNLWAKRQKELVWSATTETSSYGSIYRNIEDVVKLVIQALMKRNLVKESNRPWANAVTKPQPRSCWRSVLPPSARPGAARGAPYGNPLAIASPPAQCQAPRGWTPRAGSGPVLGHRCTQSQHGSTAEHGPFPSARACQEAVPGVASAAG